MLPPIYSLLTASSAVAALVGPASDARIYRHGQAEQGVERPYVTWSVPGGAPDNTFERADADVFRVQIDNWSDDDTEVETLAAAVRAALEPHAHLIAYIADERDDVTKRYRISFAFDFIQAR